MGGPWKGQKRKQRSGRNYLKGIVERGKIRKIFVLFVYSGIVHFSGLCILGKGVKQVIGKNRKTISICLGWEE